MLLGLELGRSSLTKKPLPGTTTKAGPEPITSTDYWNQLGMVCYPTPCCSRFMWTEEYGSLLALTSTSEKAAALLLCDGTAVPVTGITYTTGR